MDLMEYENPGALAGATGADQLGISFKTDEYRKRASAATALCLAIRECEPEDAAPILDAALATMCAGSPPPVFLGIMQDAAWWADLATRAELKAYAFACFSRLSNTDRAAFLAHVSGGGHG
ncbi:MAG TPA: hypothetical protein VIQ22_02575 [Gammaproteobacteria bacterium]